MITVGLLSGELVWLALEGLIRQETDFNWELLILEQENRGQKELYKKYISRLKEANCTSIKIIKVKTLNYKLFFKLMNSRILVVHPDDTYSHPTRLKESLTTAGVRHLNYQLCYSPNRKTFIQQRDKQNFSFNLDKRGSEVITNRKGFVVRKTSAPYLYQDVKLESIAPGIAEKVKGIKDKYSTIHFVYPYINPTMGGPIWRELYYSVKSIHKYFVGLPVKIFVVGDAPRIKGVHHIPCERIRGRINAKMFDATNKLQKIIDTPQINDDFVYIYDDTVFLKNINIDDLTKVMALEKVNNIANHFKGPGRKPSDDWIHLFNLSMLKLKHENLPTYNYETHLPRYLNKERVQKIIDKYKLTKNTYLFSSMYFNNFYKSPDLIIKNTLNLKADVTIPLEAYHLEKYVRGRKFLSYNDTGLNKDLQKYIKQLFI